MEGTITSGICKVDNVKYPFSPCTLYFTPSIQTWECYLTLGSSPSRNLNLNIDSSSHDNPLGLQPIILFNSQATTNHLSSTTAPISFHHGSPTHHPLLSTHVCPYTTLVPAANTPQHSALTPGRSLSQLPPPPQIPRRSQLTRHLGRHHPHRALYSLRDCCHMGCH